MNQYMRRRSLSHNFIDKQDLQAFIASIYGKNSIGRRVFDRCGNGQMWLPFFEAGPRGNGRRAVFTLAHRDFSNR